MSGCAYSYNIVDRDTVYINTLLTTIMHSAKKLFWIM